MENQVTKGAKPAEPQPKTPNYVPDNAPIEDLGGPTPTNNKPTDDSNKLKTPSAKFAQTGDPQTKGTAGTVQLPGPSALKSTGYGKGANEEVEAESEEVVSEEPANDETVVSEEEKVEELTIDVADDVAALVEGEDLSDEYKEKTATIFEAAVKSKIAKIRKQVREESKKDMESKTESIQKEMTEKMDEYMNYVVKEWMEENKLAVEQGVRNEVTESFISGLKKLFEEHYIDVPAEKEDVFESLVQEVAELETKLDEATQKHMDTVKDLNTYRAKDAFRDIVEGMVDTDIEKMKELTEDVDYESDEQYKEKLNIIKNSYFKSEKKLDDNKATAATNKKVTDGSSDDRMDSVMAAITHLNKSK